MEESLPCRERDGHGAGRDEAKSCRLAWRTDHQGTERVSRRRVPAVLQGSSSQRPFTTSPSRGAGKALAHHATPGPVSERPAGRSYGLRGPWKGSADAPRRLCPPKGGAVRRRVPRLLLLGGSQRARPPAAALLRGGRLCRRRQQRSAPPPPSVAPRADLAGGGDDVLLLVGQLVDLVRQVLHGARPDPAAQARRLEVGGELAVALDADDGG